MGKWIIRIIGALLVLVLAGGLILYFTDNRYSLSYRSYSALKNASSMDLSFESRMGMGENDLGIQGDTRLTMDQKASYTEVSVDLGPLGNRKIVDIYTAGEKIYHKYNLPFLSWQEGMPILQEDSFNPTMFTDLQMDVKLLDLLKFASILDRNEEEELLEYYTTDYFTPEEFKGILVGLLKLDATDVENWNIRTYEIRFSFHKNRKELEKVAVKFDYEVSEMVLGNEFILIIHELNSVQEIPVPDGIAE
ncbi:hypothetical protein ACHAL6_13910 [Proteiniclasticum sp. C24MP]|uniref:hypothetical protein n=1 Tax=Proteiniclasticum sp. C24MP TaxID=3374101 RepID=UPI0037550DBF